MTWLLVPPSTLTVWMIMVEPCTSTWMRMDLSRKALQWSWRVHPALASAWQWLRLVMSIKMDSKVQLCILYRMTCFIVQSSRDILSKSSYEFYCHVSAVENTKRQCLCRTNSVCHKWKIAHRVLLQCCHLKEYTVHAVVLPTACGRCDPEVIRYV